MRQLLCIKCGDRWKLHPEDKKVGIVAVRVRLLLSTDGLCKANEWGWKCDICDCQMFPGTPAWYVGAFQPDSTYAERDASSWRNYGKVLTDAEFNAIQILTKGEPCLHSQQP